ncbi:hypothetical protein GCM10009798_29370 [Nocardioides panacihumi]|uniref:Uncharacterized protein n=1 Tax=Nocardioides panacihumi TaxID=400774 RepID=A0ABP5CQ18_9ACTN
MKGSGDSPEYAGSLRLSDVADVAPNHACPTWLGSAKVRQLTRPHSKMQKFKEIRLNWRSGPYFRVLSAPSIAAGQPWLRMRSALL